LGKPTRNAPCPCGSGKKLKYCHGKNQPFPARDNIAGITFDYERKRTIVVTKDILLNQIHRDAPAIARSFDKLADRDLREISAVIADAVSLHFRYVAVGATDYLGTCAGLLSSALSTFMASVAVAREGHRRPYGSMARGVIETICTVIHIAVEKDALDRFHQDTLQSTKSVSVAKKVLEPLGPMYGLFSNQFVHINRLHASFEPTIKYAVDDEALPFILATLRSNAWLIYAVAELIFLKDVTEPRYWKPMGEGIVYDPSESEKIWLKEYFEGSILKADPNLGSSAPSQNAGEEK
jgi:hypothetical protein